ncbi:MAG TPA: FAD-dependent oxidoreductase [Bryobacteraceae bacterium]|nr:FAD-dependent oxidoreductase [Bryobacteraceae bacterium]
MAIPTNPDVLVCGAGCAGLGAALASARHGAKTLLIERAPFAGGIITTVGLPFFDGIARKKDGVIVTHGIPVELLTRMGVCGPFDHAIHPHNPVIHSTERFKIVVDRMLQAEPNLHFLFHTFAADVVRNGDSIAEVIVANKGGLQRIRPKTVIDATGDGDIAARAEVPLDDTGKYMPLSLHFRIGNVVNHPDLRKNCRTALMTAYQAGKLKNYYGPGIMFMFAPDEIYIHATRVNAKAADPEELTRAEIEGREEAWNMFEIWKKQVPGFENAYYVASGPYIGIRESRRIVGQYVLNEHDIKEEKQFPDAIATGCWYLDLHPSYPTSGTANAPAGTLAGLDGFQPNHYDIPYRSLLPQKAANLLVAGRCHSATRLAASSTRVTATAMAMGQAAGVAAALATELHTSVQELDGRKVREVLDRQHMGPYSGPA